MSGSKRGLKYLGAMRLVQPNEWVERIRVAMDMNSDDVHAAAKDLGVSARQVYRWIGEDPAFADLAKMLGPGNRVGGGPREPARAPTAKRDNPRQVHRLGALRLVDPTAWATEIRETMKKHDGRVPAAAAELKVSPRQLWRWLANQMLADVQRAREGNPYDEA
jgi:transcriptional regulator with PAS, ATPase and Fis domain